MLSFFKKHFFGFLIAFAYLIFLFRCVFLLDPDFGWHLKTGEYILQNGFPRLDPFSYTMPGFPLVAASWLTDVLWASLFPIIGSFGLALIWGLIPAVFLVLIYNPKQRFVFIPLLLSIFAIFGFVGVRAQVLSWIWFALLMRLLFRPNWPKKYLLTIPLIFLFWVNTHASFPVGIVTLWIVIVLRLIKNQKVRNFELLLGLLAFVVTFFNPYGTGMWREALTTFFDTTTRFFIVEWQPIIFLPLMPVFFYLALYFVFFVKYWKSFTLTEKVLGTVFAGMAISSARNVPLWLVFALPITSKGLLCFYKEAKQFPIGNKRFNKMSIYATIVVLIICFYHLRLVANGTLLTRENIFYPTLAIEYLVQNSPPGNIFSSYSWGGYLIWKYPDKKVFMDGRMTHWGNIVKDYKKITSQKADFNEYVKKFNIDTVLWPKQYIFEQPVEKLIKVIFKQKKVNPDQAFLDYLESLGWEKTYEDGVAVVYQRLYNPI